MTVTNRKPNTHRTKSELQTTTLDTMLGSMRTANTNAVTAIADTDEHIGGILKGLLE